MAHSYTPASLTSHQIVLNNKGEYRGTAYTDKKGTITQLGSLQLVQCWEYSRLNAILFLWDFESFLDPLKINKNLVPAHACGTAGAKEVPYGQTMEINHYPSAETDHSWWQPKNTYKVINISHK